MNDEQYWENYYKQQQDPFKPSLFALWCLGAFIKAQDKVLEMGCGNGRDAVFMANNQVQVTAVDQCQSEIEFLNQTVKNPNLTFKAGDFSRLDDLGKFDAIYSRFTLHAVSEAQENRVISYASEHLNDGRVFLIEARGTKNEYYGRGIPVAGERHAFIYEDHYRRFLDLEATKQKLIKKGLNIVMADEKTGRAPFKQTDFHFMRIVAQKERN